MPKTSLLLWCLHNYECMIFYLEIRWGVWDHSDFFAILSTAESKMFPCGKFRALILKYIRGENSCWQGIGECKTSFLNKQQKTYRSTVNSLPVLKDFKWALTSLAKEPMCSMTALIHFKEIKSSQLSQNFSCLPLMSYVGFRQGEFGPVTW